MSKAPNGGGAVPSSEATKLPKGSLVEAIHKNRTARKITPPAQPPQKEQK